MDKSIKGTIIDSNDVCFSFLVSCIRYANNDGRRQGLRDLSRGIHFRFSESVHRHCHAVHVHPFNHWSGTK